MQILSSLPFGLQTVLLLAASQVFMAFAWAGLCMVGAVYFVFRSA